MAMSLQRVGAAADWLTYVVVRIEVDVVVARLAEQIHDGLQVSQLGAIYLITHRGGGAGAGAGAGVGAGGCGWRRCCGGDGGGGCSW